MLFVLFLLVAQEPQRPLLPRLIDRCGREGDPNRAAPIVIVGVIQSDNVVRRPIPMHSDRGTPLQMRRMRIVVENVVRGDIREKKVAVYYFTWAGGFDGPRPLGIWGHGRRRIFRLEQDRGVLRTTCDGWDTCTWGVYSGSHPNFKINPADPIERTLADIVFTRGAGRVDDSQFAAAILQGGPIPDPYLIEKYRELALTEHAGIKGAACKALWILRHDPHLRRSSEEAMQRARCVCRVTQRGETDCGD